MRLSLSELYDILFRFYGPQNWWPIVENGVSLYLPGYTQKQRTPEEALEIWIGAILTQNTAWKNVEKALVNLKERLPLLPESLLTLSEEELSDLIRPAGYYRQKAKKIHVSMRFLLQDYGGNPCELRRLPLSEARHQLLSLWGIGPETADSILLYALGFPIFVIDTYTRRILKLLGYPEATQSYERLQDLFHKNITPDVGLYREYHALFVAAGKTCGRKPDCGRCPLFSWCERHHTRA
ncbi:Endonuclease III [Brevinematales bacterium NS]|nr:endonuclease III domain-containing protein [Brevinematales bacterium]QJR22212.1 Endonuclease III [Brevinematales bacterium NS]